MNITGLLETVQFKAGDVLFNEGDSGYHFFIIQSGQVEVYRHGKNKEKLPLGLISEGEAVGEFARFDRKPRSASARALTEVEATRVSEEAYDELIDKLPGWAAAMIEQLINRLRKTNDVLRRHGIVDEALLRELEKAENGEATNTQWIDLNKKIAKR